MRGGTQFGLGRSIQGIKMATRLIFGKIAIAIEQQHHASIHAAHMLQRLGVAWLVGQNRGMPKGRAHSGLGWR